MQKEAFGAAKAYVKVNYDDRAVEDAFEQGYAQGGYREGMRRGAQALAARFRASFAVPTDVANLYVEAGENREALDWLEKGFDVRDPNLPYLWVAFYDRLRSEPRFQALMRRMNLPQ